MNYSKTFCNQMILKFYETNKINLNHNKIILYMEKTRVLKKKLSTPNKSKNIEISNFDEKDILENFDYL